MPAERELAFATTEELVAELGARSESMIIGAVLRCDENNIFVRNCGKLHHVAGLKDAINAVVVRAMAMNMSQGKPL